MESLSGSRPSPSTISRVFHTLEEEFATWKTRPLQAHYLYLIADGTYCSVIYDGEGQHMPILAVIGINVEDKREVLGFSTGDRENQAAWEALLSPKMIKKAMARKPSKPGIMSMNLKYGSWIPCEGWVKRCHI